ncbi:MAG: BlaI/MecI/CopY family transcriptional regulator [Planctomycetaceae bacterium]|nr:BlaI/MecI/CopY family transcriptional regulator [Planctomycetaceae bacterium]
MAKTPKKMPLKLSPGELELLELLWGHGPLTIAGAHQAFLDRERQISYPTVQTRLNRLADKGILRKLDRHPTAYEAVLKPSDVSGRYFDLFDKLCGGNLAPLMLHLSGKRKLNPEELRILKEIIHSQK